MPLRTKQERRKAGLFPSQDVDVATALELLDWSWYRFSRSTEALEPAVVRRVLEALDPARPSAPLPGKAPSARDQDRRRAAALFLHAAVDTTNDASLARSWSAAVEALKIFESQYAWGSKQKAARLAHVRADPQLVEACRAAAVGVQRVPLELLAVLVMEGSEGSADALMPHVERALKNELELEPLAQLVRYAANTKAMSALVSVVETALEASRGDSKAMALATKLGIASGKRFRVEARVTGTGGASFWIDVDSTRPGAGYRGWVHEAATRGESLVSEDGEACAELDAFPRWIGAWARAHSVEWSFDTATTRHLRGPRLTRFLAWLSSGTS